MSQPTVQRRWIRAGLVAAICAATFVARVFAQQAISGQPVMPTARATVNYTDLQNRVPLLALQNRPRAVPEPGRLPQNHSLPPGAKKSISPRSFRVTNLPEAAALASPMPAITF